MLMDGRTLAKTVVANLATTVSSWATPPHLTVFTCEPNFETTKFLGLKQHYAKAAGITVSLQVLPATVSIDEVRSAIQRVTATTDGIIIQFPFPHVATSDLIPLVPPAYDVDVMHYDGALTLPLPPVVGAIDMLATEYAVSFADKRVVIVGNGRLVGAPSALYARAKGGAVQILTKETFSASVVQAADILILGAGVPGLVTPAMVHADMVIFDAGTSEEGGVLVGDAEASVGDLVHYLSPVPGGIGPLTIAVLLKNVVHMAAVRRKEADFVV